MASLSCITGIGSGFHCQPYFDFRFLLALFFDQDLARSMNVDRTRVVVGDEASFSEAINKRFDEEVIVVKESTPVSGNAEIKARRASFFIRVMT